MIVGLGSDLIDINRVARTLERHGARFTGRVFTEVERGKSDRRLNRAASYAKRFAAKEACAKALGTGLSRGVFWRDMGVVNLPGGKPTMALTGGAGRTPCKPDAGRPRAAHPRHHHRRRPLGAGLCHHRGASGGFRGLILRHL